MRQKCQIIYSSNNRERVETYLKNIQKISSNNEMIYIIPHHKNIIEEERRKKNHMCKKNGDKIHAEIIV